MAPKENWAREIRCYFSLYFLRSVYSQTHLFFYQFILYMYSNESMAGEW